VVQIIMNTPLLPRREGDEKDYVRSRRKTQRFFHDKHSLSADDCVHVRDEDSKMDEAKCNSDGDQTKVKS
jgi:hypothetical protein